MSAKIRKQSILLYSWMRLRLFMLMEYTLAKLAKAKHITINCAIEPSLFYAF